MMKKHQQPQRQYKLISIAIFAFAGAFVIYLLNEYKEYNKYPLDRYAASNVISSKSSPPATKDDDNGEYDDDYFTEVKECNM